MAELQPPLSWSVSSDGRRRKGSLDFLGLPMDESEWNSFTRDDQLPLLSLKKERELYDQASQAIIDFPSSDPNFSFKEEKTCEQESNFEGRIFDGAFVNAQSWKSEYQRNYRKLGGKNLRCFPYCSDVHQRTTFCGDALQFNIKLRSIGFDSRNQLSDSDELRFCVFAEFSPVEREDGSIVPPNVLLGGRMDKVDVIRKVTARKDEIQWWPAVQVHQNQPTKPRSNSRITGKSAIKYSEFTEEQLRAGVVVEFNKEKRAWHYGVAVNKTSKSMKHGVNIYIFSYRIASKVQEASFPKLIDELYETDFLECSAFFRSPSFELYGRKPKSSVKSVEKGSDSGSTHKRSVAESYSDAIESFGDSDFDLENVTTLEDFDLDDLDLLKTAETGSLARKRSFIDDFDCYEAATTGSSSYPEEDLWNGSYGSPTNGLKKMRSARNFSALDTLLESFEMPQQKVNKEQLVLGSHIPVISSTTPLSTQPPSLLRCSSAPTIKVNRLQATRKFSNLPVDHEQGKIVFMLFKDIISGSQDKFVKVVTRFLLSANETLTEVLQGSLKEILSANDGASLQERDVSSKMLCTCFQFLHKNFPPFKIYCSKKQKLNESQFDNAEYETVLQKLIEHQYGFIANNSLSNGAPPISFELDNFYNHFRGTWQLREADIGALNEIYTSVGFSNSIASCFVAMDQTLTLDFEPNISALVIKSKEKLFCSGRQRLVFDHQPRQWCLTSPLLGGKLSFKEYRASVCVAEGKILIEFLFSDASIKATRTFEVVDGYLVSSWCLFKPSVVPLHTNEPNWALVYASKTHSSRV